MKWVAWKMSVTHFQKCLVGWEAGHFLACAGRSNQELTRFLVSPQPGLQTLPWSAMPVAATALATRSAAEATLWIEADSAPQMFRLRFPMSPDIMTSEDMSPARFAGRFVMTRISLPSMTYFP